MMVQSILKANPFSGHLFAFCDRMASLIKLLWWHGTGL